jgi:anti-anti-sigma factor
MTWLCPLPEDDAPGPGRVAIEVDVGAEATTILIRGDLDLVTVPALAEQLAALSRDKPGQLVFDLTGTRFMDCGSARLIAESGQWLRDGRRPVIRRPGPGVRRLLALTGLDVYCEIEALAMGNGVSASQGKAGAGR